MIGGAKCDLRTAVTVLPWHDPVRLAENIILLQRREKVLPRLVDIRSSAAVAP